MLSACAGSISDTPLIAGTPPRQPAPAPLPVSQPRSAEFQKLIETYGGEYNNNKMATEVQSLIGRLVEASDQPNRSVNLTILNSPAINAFALPSGDLFLTRGLITLANDESELAAVIAHELAHVTADHARLRQRQARAAALAQRVSDVVDDPAIKLETRETAEVSLASFSQRQELQADEIGVRTLAKAGFDPYAAARFLGSMARYAALPAFNAASSPSPGFLSSHPSTPSRVANARRVARGFSAPGVGITGRDRYLEHLDGALFGDDPRQGYVRAREFAHVTLGIAFEVPKGYVLKNTSAAVLATDGQHTAIRFDAVAVPPRQDLADYLRSGWVKGLISDSVRETTVDGQETATASALVDGWSFRIGVIRGNQRVYRFIFASSKPASAYEDAFRRTLASFRLLTPADRARMRPLTIRIVTVRPGDTVASLSQRMDGVDPDVKRPLFETLNGLGNETDLKAGMKVKLVVE
ncbi:MAG: M48 family metalloprotease [Acuticoccus sp.]